MYTTSRRDLKAMVGGGGTRSRPRYCLPRGPAIANHLIHQDEHNQVSRRCVASDARNRVPKQQREYLLCLPPETKKHRQAPGTQPPEAPGLTREFLVWPDIPPTWELEYEHRGHSETWVELFSCSVPGSVAQLLARSRSEGSQTSLFPRERDLPCRVAPSRARAPVLVVASEKSWAQLPCRRDFCDHGKPSLVSGMLGLLRDKTGAQAQSDSNQQATGTGLRRRVPQKFTSGGPIVKLFLLGDASFPKHSLLGHLSWPRRHLLSCGARPVIWLHSAVCRSHDRQDGLFRSILCEG